MKKNVFLGPVAAMMASAAIGGVMHVGTPPNLDGRLDDSCWQKAKWEGGFRLFQHKARELGDETRKPIGGDTEFAVLADERNLYVGIRAKHDMMDKLLALPKGGQWASEAVELMLMPSGGEFEYYHFLVAQPGQMWAMFYSEAGNITPDPFGPVWDRAISNEADAWTAEVRIPFSAFYMTRNSSWAKTWRMNVGRTYKRPGNGCGDNSSWCDNAAAYCEIPAFREMGPFPMRRAEDDLCIKSLVADVHGVEDGKTVGDMRVSVYVAKGGVFTFESPYTKPMRVTLSAGDGEFSVPAVFPVNGRHVTEVKLVRVGDGTTCARTYPLRVDYVPVRVKLTTPQYRNNFYPGQCADVVEGMVKAVAADPIVLMLEGPGFDRQTTTLTHSGKFSFDTKGFAYGDAKLTVSCGVDKVERKIRRLPPLPKGRHMTWIENGNLVLDGRPTVIRNIYAEGFCGGFAFDAKYSADKASGKLHITRDFIEMGSTDPRWVLPEVKYGEVLEDVELSQKMKDALDKMLSRARKDGAYYYGSDEPECHGMSAVYLGNVYDYVAEKDPYHVILCCCRSGDTYGAIADVFAAHPYINPYVHPDGHRTYGRDFKVLGGYIDAYHPEEHPDKCIGGAPTCFAYSSGDYPTFEEYVLNYWCEFVRGAKVMFPYAYHDLGDRPQMYEGTRYMFESIEALEDVILYGKRRTVCKTGDYECALWTMPAGDRMFVIVNFTQKPQKVTIENVWGRYREFRGDRTFAADEAGCMTIELKPLEALVACEKSRDAGLRMFADVKAEIDGLERVRMNRGNQLYRRDIDLEIATSNGRKGPWWDTPRELFDGTLDVVGWAPQWGEKYYAMNFRNGFAPKFDTVRVFGKNHEGYTLSVADGRGGWSKLEPVATKKDGLCITLTFGHVLSPSGIRFDFPAKGALEVYEFELPEVK